MKTSRVAHNDSDAAQIAQTLIEEAKQGTLASTPGYLDQDGAACASIHAAYTVLPTTDSPAAGVTRVTLRITPVGMPDRLRIYAVEFPSQN